jgi:hypothetical protein
LSLIPGTETRTSHSKTVEQNSSENSPETEPQKQKTKTKDELFRFATLGDFDANERTSNTLSAIAKQHTDFTLGLGDFSYGTVSEIHWCGLVKEKLGRKYPFELIAGNHDLNFGHGEIQNFAKCLPNRIPGMVGAYTEQFYFDYKDSMRIIAISPNLTFNNGKTYNYRKGKSEYAWLNKAIDGARDKDMPWVTVAMHKNCISFGVKTCEIGSDLMNLLLKKKVNLILQGHEHAYLRSFQLALSDRCTRLKSESFNPGCVVRPPQKNRYLSTSGSLLVINGTGGKELREFNFDDPEKNYFADWHSTGSVPVNGPTIIKVHNHKLVIELIDSAGFVVQDKFIILKP